MLDGLLLVGLDEFATEERLDASSLRPNESKNEFGSLGAALPSGEGENRDEAVLVDDGESILVLRLADDVLV